MICSRENLVAFEQTQHVEDKKQLLRLPKLFFYARVFAACLIDARHQEFAQTKEQNWPGPKGTLPF